MFERFDRWFDEWFSNLSFEGQVLVAISPLLVMSVVIIIMALIFG